MPMLSLSRRHVVILITVVLTLIILVAISTSFSSLQNSYSDSSSSSTTTDGDPPEPSEASPKPAKSHKVTTITKQESVLQQTKLNAPKQSNAKSHLEEDRNQPNQQHQLHFRDVPQCALDLFEKAKQTGKNLPDRNVLLPSSSSKQQKVHPLISETYMIHYSPSVKRRKVMTDLLKHHNVEVTRWILEFDRENITEDMKNCLHNSFDPKLYKQNPKKAKRPKPLSPLLPIQSSVVTKHFFALYLAATHRDDDDDEAEEEEKYFLILEDDVFLRNGFGDHFETLLKEMRAKEVHQMKGKRNKNKNLPLFDVMMIGGCLKMHANRKKGKGIKFPAPKVTPHLFWRNEARCAHAYIVSKNGARKILDSMPMTHPIDFQLNAAFQEEGDDFEKNRNNNNNNLQNSNQNNNNNNNNILDASVPLSSSDDKLKVLWTEPWLAVQGDIDGGCVTAKFYGKCPSIELNPGPEFDVKMLKTKNGF